jgi:hypothetical protein
VAFAPLPNGTDIPVTLAQMIAKTSEANLSVLILTLALAIYLPLILRVGCSGTAESGVTKGAGRTHFRTNMLRMVHLRRHETSAKREISGAGFLVMLHKEG